MHAFKFSTSLFSTVNGVTGIQSGPKSEVPKAQELNLTLDQMNKSQTLRYMKPPTGNENTPYTSAQWHLKTPEYLFVEV